VQDAVLEFDYETSLKTFDENHLVIYKLTHAVSPIYQKLINRVKHDGKEFGYS